MSFERQFTIATASKEEEITLHLDKYRGKNVIHRKATLTASDDKSMDLWITHSPASALIYYLSKQHVTPSFAQLLKLPENSKWIGRSVTIPGQLILGFQRTRLFNEAVDDCFRNEPLESDLTDLGQDRIVSVPVLREGIKYGVAGVLNDRFDFYVDEIVADVCHQEDQDDPLYGRSFEINVFKDDDVDDRIRASVECAVVGDSIASGTVILGLIRHLQQRFPAVNRLELICPLATVHGLGRILVQAPEGFTIRAHCLETVLNALPPDYYWSAHYNQPEMHIRRDLHEKYQQWWGASESGDPIADTACAGFGWSEAFFNPRKQIALINQQLRERHNTTIAELILRNNK